MFSLQPVASSTPPLKYSLPHLSPATISSGAEVGTLLTLPVFGSIPAGFPEDHDCVPVELAEIHLP